MRIVTDCRRASGAYPSGNVTVTGIGVSFRNRSSQSSWLSTVSAKRRLKMISPDQT
jgi:hypothetical protein